MEKMVKYIYGIICFLIWSILSSSCTPQHIAPLTVANKRSPLRWPDTGDLTLDVDSVVVTEELQYPPKHAAKSGEVMQTETVTVNSYTLYVKNVSTDTLLIGYGDKYYPVSIEAQDSLGSWKVIHNILMQDCFSGVPDTLLYPGVTAPVTFRILVGNMKTMVRVCFGFRNYSDSFIACIRPGSLIAGSTE